MLARLRLRLPSAVFLFLSPRQSSPRRALLRRPRPAIHESVVVTATGRDMPESKVGASITVLESRPDRTAACAEHDRPAQNDTRSRRRPLGRRRQPDRRLRPRRRIDLQQSADRRHAAERAGRRVQFRVAVAGKHRAHRSAARRAFGAVRIGCDGQRHSALLGAPRHGTAASEPDRRRRHLQHGAPRGWRRRANGRRRILGIRLAPPDRQSKSRTTRTPHRQCRAASPGC